MASGKSPSKALFSLHLRSTPCESLLTSGVAAPRPSLAAGLNELVHTRPMTGVSQGDAPCLLNTSYRLTADITVPQGGAEGMIATLGTSSAVQPISCTCPARSR
jgi:hypothetical protein